MKTDFFNKHPLKKKTIIGMVTGIILCMLGIKIYKVISDNFINPNMKQRILYVKNNELYMTDLQNLKRQEAVCTFPDIYNWYRYRGFYNDMVIQSFLTKDQSYIYFPENYSEEGDTFDLCRAKISNFKEKKVLDTCCTQYELLGEYVLYVKSGVIYYDDGKEKREFGNAVCEYRIDDKKEKILWTEEKRFGDVSTYTLYYQDLIQENEKTKIYSGLERGSFINSIYPKTDFSAVFIKDENSIYRIANNGEKEKLNLCGINEDEGSFIWLCDIDADEEKLCYVTSGIYEKVWILKDFIYDDTGIMTESDWNSIEGIGLVWDGGCYFYDKGDIKRLSEAAHIAYGHLSDTGCVIVKELNDNIRVKWSDYKRKRDERPEFQSDIIWGSWIADNKLAVDGNIVLDLGGGDGDKQFKFLDRQSEYVYVYSCEELNGFYVTDRDDKVYAVCIDGERKGEIQECELAFERAVLLSADEEGIYYISDWNNGYGDLYYQDKLLVPDIHNAYIGYDKILCCTDHDEKNGCTYELYDGDGIQKIGERVKALQYMENGQIFMLANYDSESGIGDLIYYDGKQNVLVDENISSLVMKDGPSIVVQGMDKK